MHYFVYSVMKTEVTRMPKWCRGVRELKSSIKCKCMMGVLS